MKRPFPYWEYIGNTFGIHGNTCIPRAVGKLGIQYSRVFPCIPVYSRVFPKFSGLYIGWGEYIGNTWEYMGIHGNTWEYTYSQAFGNTWEYCKGKACRRVSGALPAKITKTVTDLRTVTDSVITLFQHTCTSCIA
jgi:hypothetical protein